MYAADTDSPASQSKPWFVSEANLPEGFPAAGPVDEVIVKHIRSIVWHVCSQTLVLTVCSGNSSITSNEMTSR